MLKNKGQWIVLGVILVIAALFRVDFLRSVQHSIPHDTHYYDLLVRQWIEHGIFAYKDTVPNASVTPGYPLIMAAVYKWVDYTAHDPFVYLRWLNLLLSMASLVLIFLIGRRWAGRATGLLAVLGAAIYPPFIWANGAVLTEVPASFLLLSYLYVQLRAFESRKWTHALIAGILLGATALIRPEFMPLCVPLYLFYWLQTRRRDTWKLLLVSLIGISVVMSPWWIRNVVTLHQLILTATQTNPFSAGTYPYKNFDDHMIDTQGKSDKEIGIERLRVGFTEHTGLFLKWYTIGKLDYTYGKMFYGAGFTPNYQVVPKQDWYHLGIILSGLAGMVLSLRHWRRPLAALTLVIVVMSGIRLLFIPEYRYNFTMMPLIILFSAYTGILIVRWLATVLRLRNLSAAWYQPDQTRRDITNDNA